MKLVKIFAVWIKIFLAMVQFFTRIPIKSNIILEKQDFGKGLIFAPLVGGVIGLFLLVLYNILITFMPLQMTAVFLIIGYMLITGGLHLDGLGDTFDGMFSNRPKEQILEIMRDSRVGTNAVLGIFSILLMNYATICSIKSDTIGVAILLMPVAGRIGSLVGAGLHTYARSGEGLGKTFIDFCGIKEIVIGFILGTVVFYLLAGPKGVGIAFLMLFSAIFVSKFFARKIGGTTGDVLGAVCEINQTMFLVAFFLVF